MFLSNPAAAECVVNFHIFGLINWYFTLQSKSMNHLSDIMKYARALKSKAPIDGLWLK